MKAIILAGGHGTRMHPLTLRTPKSLLPINGLPNIIHIINSLNNAGINDIYVSINESQLKINDFLKDKKVNIIIENQDNGKLGSIGGLYYAINKVGDDDIIVVGADNFFQGLDFRALSESINNNAVIVLYELPDKLMVEHYGIAELDNGIIKSFQEKPRISEAKSKLASTLVYGLSKDWVKNKLPEYISNNKNLDTIGSMWQYFCNKDSLHGFKFNGVWADIGNPRSYVELNKKVMVNKVSDNIVIGKGTIIKEPVIIDDGCVIGNNCVIGPFTHLMHDSTVGSGSIINSSIVFENVHIGRNTVINNSVIDGSSMINNGVIINDYCVIGFKSIIDNNSRLLRGSRVWPYLKASGVIDGDVVLIKGSDDLLKSKYWCDG